MFVKVALLACIATCASICQWGDDPLVISAFNVQIFGKTKMNKSEVVEILIKIIKRYDLIVIQEIRDIDEVAFPLLVKEINGASNSSNQFGMILSPRIGRTRSKEQYGFIYRTDRVNSTLKYKFSDGEDVFEREPYIVEFERLGQGNQTKFNVIPLHAKPDDAKSEMNQLVQVYEDAVLRTGHNSSLIVGDLNADCRYVCKSCWPKVKLRGDSRFTWKIGDDADTTVTSTDCAYDRIITTGEMTEISGQATVFQFDTEYGLSYQEAKLVSDHYPVEIRVY